MNVKTTFSKCASFFFYYFTHNCTELVQRLCHRNTLGLFSIGKCKVTNKPQIDDEPNICRDFYRYTTYELAARKNGL